MACNDYQILCLFYFCIDFVNTSLRFSLLNTRHYEFKSFMLVMYETQMFFMYPRNVEYVCSLLYG
jgi:hypothetical protein